MNLYKFDKEYKDFINFLYSLKDEKYKEFHLKLLKDDSVNLIGIRVPVLKQIAKNIAKSDYKNFIENTTKSTYEEIMIYGLVIGYLKLPFKEILDLINDFIPYNTNWAINDTVCANLKCFKNNLDEGYLYIKKLLNSNNEWKIRFGLVLLLDFYINDQYIDDILKICNNVNNKIYYVQMANAWLLSVCYIKYPKKTYQFLLSTNLDDFTFNKAISKICDSYRVNKEDKKELKRMKRK